MHPAPVAWHVTHWGTDQWSRGSWTSLGVGGSTTDRATAGTPVDDRFVLAGDATNPVALGVDGFQTPRDLGFGSGGEAVADGGYLVGDQLTLADAFLLPHLLFFGRTPEGAALLQTTPAAAAWRIASSRSADRRLSTSSTTAFNAMCRAFLLLREVAAATVSIALPMLTLLHCSLKSSPRRRPVFIATMHRSRR